MSLLLKLVIILFGIAAIAMGVKSIATREAKFSWSEDSDEQRIAEGFPAIIIGLGEIGMGLYMIFAQLFPSSH